MGFLVAARGGGPKQQASRAPEVMRSHLRVPHLALVPLACCASPPCCSLCAWLLLTASRHRTDTRPQSHEMPDFGDGHKRPLLRSHLAFSALLRGAELRFPPKGLPRHRAAAGPSLPALLSAGQTQLVRPLVGTSHQAPLQVLGRGFAEL